VAHEGIETDCEVWSLARKLKILGRLRLFRLVVTGVGRVQQVAANSCKHRAPILSRDHSGDANMALLDGALLRLDKLIENAL